MTDQPGSRPGAALGDYLRSQRQLAQLTLRQLAELSRVSNAYLSQIERGLHQPSVTVLRSVADALNVSLDELLARLAGAPEPDEGRRTDTEAAIRADPRLDASQQAALLGVYRSMVARSPAGSPGPRGGAEPGSGPPARGGSRRRT